MSVTRKIIPIVANAAATQKSANEEIRGCAELEPYALRVMGDSMVPEFREGHVIILDPGLPVRDNAYVVMEINGEALFGQYKKEEDRVFLKFLNGIYPSVELTDRCRLLGVVIQRSGRRRADRKHYD